MGGQPEGRGGAGDILWLADATEAMELYGLSEEELSAWHAAVEQHGETALKATTLQRYR